MPKQKQVVNDHKGFGVIRLLKGSKNYFMRFRFHDQKGWTPWRRTGTPDLATARKKASDEYHLLRGRLGAEENFDVRRLYDDYTFIGAANRWLEMYESKAKAGLSAGSGRRAASLAQHKAYKLLIERYIAEFFERKKLSSITSQDIIDYINFRRTYYTEGPDAKIDTVKTKRRGKEYDHKVKHKEVDLRSGELYIIRAIFEFASKEGLITAKQIPDIPRPSNSAKDVIKSRYPAFSKEHWKIVEDKIDAFTKDRNENYLQSRTVFKYFLLILAETGLRVSNEHPLIKWRHIEFDTVEDTGDKITYIYVPEETKTGSRVIIVGPHGTKLIEELKAWVIPPFSRVSASRTL